MESKTLNLLERLLSSSIRRVRHRNRPEKTRCFVFEHEYILDHFLHRTRRYVTTLNFFRELYIDLLNLRTVTTRTVYRRIGKVSLDTGTGTQDRCQPHHALTPRVFLSPSSTTRGTFTTRSLVFPGTGSPPLLRPRSLGSLWSSRFTPVLVKTPKNKRKQKLTYTNK